MRMRMRMRIKKQSKDDEETRSGTIIKPIRATVMDYNEAPISIGNDPCRMAPPVLPILHLVHHTLCWISLSLSLRSLTRSLIYLFTYTLIYFAASSVVCCRPTRQLVFSFALLKKLSRAEAESTNQLLESI